MGSKIDRQNCTRTKVMFECFCWGGRSCSAEQFEGNMAWLGGSTRIDDHVRILRISRRSPFSPRVFARARCASARVRVRACASLVVSRGLLFVCCLVGSGLACSWFVLACFKGLPGNKFQVVACNSASFWLRFWQVCGSPGTQNTPRVAITSFEMLPPRKSFFSKRVFLGAHLLCGIPSSNLSTWPPRLDSGGFLIKLMLK